MKAGCGEYGRLYYECTIYGTDDVDGKKGMEKVGRTVGLQYKIVRRRCHAGRREDKGGDSVSPGR